MYFERTKQQTWLMSAVDVQTTPFFMFKFNFHDTLYQLQMKSGKELCTVYKHETVHSSFPLRGCTPGSSVHQRNSCEFHIMRTLVMMLKKEN